MMASRGMIASPPPQTILKPLTPVLDARDEAEVVDARDGHVRVVRAECDLELAGEQLRERVPQPEAGEGARVGGHVEEFAPRSRPPRGRR